MRIQMKWKGLKNMHLWMYGQWPLAGALVTSVSILLPTVYHTIQSFPLTGLGGLGQNDLTPTLLSHKVLLGQLGLIKKKIANSEIKKINNIYKHAHIFNTWKEKGKENKCTQLKGKDT